MVRKVPYIHSIGIFKSFIYSVFISILSESNSLKKTLEEVLFICLLAAASGMRVNSFQVTTKGILNTQRY